ncbi:MULTISPECIES: hypothetical protein [unclassified Cytobacillus]|uniref:hypothetical protein n=1 Tax=unclassified Cytobacillus TaxID=2675268 RepID=UPI00135C2EA3|nr:hypothetical protein [Cytobacillus sp. AMY 15.2]KAF0817642.1 hypothetical protein KIS4809_3459 [Bacillus sp. ZZV12-4809]MCM3092177.1 hypothetical protein [Cytobacillus sp. AMY 15.2]
MSQQSKKQITEKDKNILKALCELYKEKQSGVGPSEIGLKVGRDKYDAAAYCNLSLKKLIEFNLVEKLSEGKYRPVEKDKD